MKLQFGPKIYIPSPLNFALLLFAAFVWGVGPVSAQAQSSTSSTQYVTPPLIGKLTPKQIAGERYAYLRKSIQPVLEDYMPSAANSALLPKAGKPLGRVADDEPSSPTASVVTSTEQTIDLTLAAYTGLTDNPTTGLPTVATPNNTDVIWSHDESFLVFASNAPTGLSTGVYHLYAMAASGGPIAYSSTNTPIYIEQLTGTTAATAPYDDRYPSLLGPNDNSIAYCTDNNSDNQLELVVAPFTNSGSGYAVNQADVTPVAAGYEARHPFYAGNEIVFSGRTNNTDAYNIFILTIGGSNAPQQLTGPSTGLAGFDNDNPNLSNLGQLVWDTTATAFNSTPGAVSPDTPLTATSVSSPLHRNIWESSASGVGVQALTEPSSSYDNEHPVWSTGQTNDFVYGTNGLDLFFDSNRVSPYPPTNTNAGHSIYYYPAYSLLSLATQVTTAAAVGTLDLYISQAATANFPVGTIIIVDQGLDTQETKTVVAVNSTTAPYYIQVGSGFTYPHAIGSIVQVLSTNPSLVTEQQAGFVDQVNTSNPSHSFDDEQAAVSSLVAPYISVAYISNRFLLDTISDNPLSLSQLHNSTTVQTAYNDAPLDPINGNGTSAIDIDPGSYGVTSYTGMDPNAGVTPQPASEVLISRLTDIDPPSLIRFNEGDSEVIHVSPGDITSYNASSTTTQYVPPGQDATFVVRLSDRQTGIGQAWLQIKDPESASQDTTGLEHKVYTQELNGTFHDAVNEATTLFDGPAIGGINGTNVIYLGNQMEYATDPATVNQEGVTILTGFNAGSTSISVSSLNGLVAGEEVILNEGAGNAEVVQITGVTQAANGNPPSIQVTATINGHNPGEDVAIVAGITTVTANLDNPATYNIPIVSNVNNVGGRNTQLFSVGDVVAIYPEASATTPPGNGPEYGEITSIPNNNTLVIDTAILNNPATKGNVNGFQDTYPKGSIVERVGQASFDYLGQEVDCQAIDTSLTANGIPANGTVEQDLISGLPGSYYIPTYTPGVDDTGAFVAPPTNSGGSNTYWLPLQALPANLQDSNGGILYYATWNTPLDPSDYYIDVIAEDASMSENWRIYDNVWGFSTDNFQSSNNILIVNDYALPQKFFSRSGQNGPDHVWGTESYWTDINNNIAAWQTQYATPANQQTAAQQADAPPAILPLVASEWTTGNNSAEVGRAKLTFGPFGGGGSASVPYFPPYANGLGINSYFDGELNETSSVGTAPEKTTVANSQKYDIWRILSRGPLPAYILDSYRGGVKQQPPNPYATPYTGDPIQTLVSPSCVIWLSPYSGDVYSGPGTITDPTTQANLTEYLNAGGRLHIEGKDIGYALTDNGAVANTFYTGELNNNYVPVGGAISAFITDDVGNVDGVTVLTGAGNQSDSISHDAFVNNTGLHNLSIDTFHGLNGNGGFVIPDDNKDTYSYAPPNSEALIVAHPDFLVGQTSGRTDASLDCYSASSFMDGFNSAATTELSGTTNKEVFYRSTAAVGSPGFGSIVSYSSFGMATISQEVQPLTFGPGNDYLVLNERSNLIHNIVCTLRTGTITGTVASSADATQLLPGTIVTAQLSEIGGYNNNGQVFTTTADSSGSYSVHGLVPGRYNISAYKEGFSFQHSLQAVDVHGGDTAGFDVTLSPVGNGTLSVTVVDQNNNPIFGATVTPTEIAGGTAPSPLTTNTSGIATFPSIAAGLYTVLASKVGYTTPTATNVTITTGTTTSITITLDALPTVISGVVNNVSASPATPIAGATLTVTDVNGNPILSTVTQQPFTATSANDGTYTITVPGGTLPSGSVLYVQGTATGFDPNTPVSIGTVNNTQIYTGVDIPLTVAPVLNVTVVNARTPSQGISGVVVTASNVPNGGTITLPTQTTSANGTVSFTLPQAGTYTVTLTPSSYQPAYSGIASPAAPITVTVPAAGTGAVTISLTPASSLTVNVTDALSGNGVDGVAVVLTPQSGTTLGPLDTTGPGGTSDFTSINPGTYTVTLSGYQPAYTSIVSPSQPIVVTVQDEQSAVSNITLQPALGTVTGTVTDAQTGLPISGATVTITDGAHTPTPATTNSNGVYTFNNVYIGNYTATTTATNYNTATTTGIVVTTGATTTTNIQLTPIDGSITGTVTSSFTGAVIAGATVALSGGTVPYSATTNASGVYTISNVEVGTYTPTVSAANYDTATEATVTITANTVLTENYKLNPAFIHQYAAGLQMFSAPYDYSGQSLASVLTGSYDAQNNEPNDIAIWLPSQNEYGTTLTTGAPCDTLHAGLGYWGRFKASGGFLVSAGTVVSAGKEILLSPGWNMIADPYTAAVDLSALTFYDSRGQGDPNQNGAPYTFSSASTAGGVSLISPYLYGYSVGATVYTSIYPGGPNGQALEPYQGYWIYANTACTLVY